jgi:MoaA/NifB/PqqE/SkfB family radical SAM enzyme
MQLISIPKLFFNYINFLRKRTPLLAGYKITYKCNLNCKHCPFWKIKKITPGFSEIKNTLDKLYKTGARLIIFEGGEPTLWKDGKYTFNDILKYAKEKFLSVNFTTNGLNGFDYYTDAIWVSIDGLEKTHDHIRGHGVFRKVLNNLHEFRKISQFMKKPPKIFANICISNINYKEIPLLINILNNLFDGFTIQFYYPYNNNFDFFLPIDKRIWVLNRIKELKRNGLKILDSFATLDDLKRNTWTCKPEGLINAEPDGSINHGCYLKDRGEINCKYCGFAAHVELSKALSLSIPSIKVGMKIFF